MRIQAASAPPSRPPSSLRRPGLIALALLLPAVAEGVLFTRYPPGIVPFAIGMGLGIALYHSAFGFTSAYRKLIVAGDTSGLEAQFLMVALATVLFAPALAQGSIFGRSVAGATAPLSWTVAAGAFAFGIGMQLAGGCASGTLYALGGGRLRSVLVLIAFCAGGFWASLDMGRRPGLFAGTPVVLGEWIGWPRAAAAQAAALLLAVVFLRALRRGRAKKRAAFSWRRIAQGPWPMIAGAVALAVLNFATLAAAGHPWTITWGFTLWGAKAAAALGWNPAGNPLWSAPVMQEALRASVVEDPTSVMNLAIAAGAFAAAVAAGGPAPRWGIPRRAAAAALIGGLVMGYGARIAYGCNIGAFFSGAASTSLHGWLWFLAALPGNWIGVKLRPLFGLDNS